jgi:hypothetical protein
VTLGELIDYLQVLPQSALFHRGLVNPHSYRGYYEQLAFEPTDLMQTGMRLLEVARSAVNETYTGYKGGSFTMDHWTPVWVANSGHTGEELTQDMLDSWRVDNQPPAGASLLLTPRELQGAVGSGARFISGEEMLLQRVQRLERILANTFPKPEGMELEEFLDRLDREGS